MKEKYPVGAYFYPITTNSPERVLRAKQYGYTLINEVDLAAQANPLYKKHKQPNIYCLGDLESTPWDDTNIKSMEKQIDLAIKYGINFFIFNTYIGSKDGKIVTEMTEPLDNAFLVSESNNFLKFGLMFTLGHPRALLPIPADPKFEEPNRLFDINKLTAKTIIDICNQKYWNKNNYFSINDRPYISLYKGGLNLSANSKDFEMFKNFIHFMKKYSMLNYNINPYIVGVIKEVSDSKPLESCGVDALSGYAFLPDFSKNSSSIQNYDTLLNKREAEWNTITSNCKIPFIPPVVVGWDASPRGERGHSLESVSGLYPFTPIVEGSGPRAFEKMFKDSQNFVDRNVRRGEKYTIVCAWNEVSEGCSLLPTIEKGNINFGYLESIKNNNL